jgi:hypothetical protein
MARERTIPSTSTFIQDFGLNVTPPPIARNRKVVILGTAEDGPQYEPILIDKPEDAEFVWGRNGAGDLVRGIFECWDVQTGYPTVVGVRIGNGKQASLEINEAGGVGVDTPQGSATAAIKLTALYPGSIYNQVVIGYNENREVAIYNPKTGLTSTFTVDTEHPNNTNAVAHNVSELVDAINSDRNLNSILVASYEPLQADYEVMISGTSTGVTNYDEKVSISLAAILQNNYVTTSGYLVPEPEGTGVTSANNLVEMQLVEAVSTSEWEDLANKGIVTSKLAIMPLDGKGTSRWDTLQAMKDYDSDNYWQHDPSGNVVSEYIYSLKYELMDGGNGEGGPTESGGLSGVTNTFRIAVPICLDDSEETGGTDVASGYILSLSGSTYNKYYSTWTNATCQGIDAKLVNRYDARPSGLIKVYVSEDSDINGFWTELPYSENSGVYLSGFAGGYATFAIGSGLVAGTISGVMRRLVDASGIILADKFLRVSANTTKGFLGEVETLPELEDAGSASLQTYFVRGQEILFNKAPDFDMIVNYGTRITYEPGSTVTVSDINNGEVTFTTSGFLPGPGGGKLSNSQVSYLRFRYTYMPNWPDITSASKALVGGTNGNILNGRERREELQKAYDMLRNYDGEIWVPMGAFIDATTERFNPITGLKETVPVGYHTQLEDFLDDLSINSLQPHAILGVSPMTEVTQYNKDMWVEKLTIANQNDPTRGSNIMNSIQNKFMSVVAFEPIFFNIGRGQPYTANGQAAYAGQLASLQYDISPTNKGILGISSLRFGLSVSQYEALNSMRYVMMKVRPGRTPVVVEDVTAAPYGSDFINWTTFSITKEAADRVKGVANEFIGRPNSIEIRTSLEQLISNTLNTMDGLRAFDFSLTSSPDQQVLGIIEIDLILVPIFTIKKIRTTVKLRKNLPTNR